MILIKNFTKNKLDQNKAMIDRVDYCLKNCVELNDWENDFCVSILDQLMEGRTLTERQIEKLEQIEYLTSWGRESFWEEFGRGN